MESEKLTVRCSDGHLYRWIPLMSFKTMRPGKRRYQRCPLCGRQRMFRRLEESELTEEQRVETQKHFDGLGP